MHKWFIFVFVSAVGLSALAQVKPLQPHDDHRSREQRRLELRTVLQAQRNPEQSLVDDKSSVARQLSSEEHALLREQLRQQRTDKPASP